MKKSIVKLLIGLFSLAAVWNLGHLSAALQRESQRQQALSAAAEDLEAVAGQLKSELSALQTDSAVSKTLRQSGFISKGDIVFFDGG